MKIAIPLADGKLAAHFGHCQEFAIIEVEEDEITNKQTLVPPPHEPGVLPAWPHEMNTNMIIAGSMGQRAIGLFDQLGMKVITGAPVQKPEELVKSYLDNTLITGGNVCDH
jgi:predicted Fe-Mo cluster-binding NifX family protein